MQEWYDRQYSPILNRDMEHALIGHDGKLCLAFAPQNGHTWDFRNFGMVETVRPWIDAGRLKILLVDSIDEETWSDANGDGRYRIELQERWFHYIMEELLPQYLPWDQKAMATGCSMGGVHAANAFFRRPDRFDTLISLSGLFDASHFFHGYMDDLVYANSPIHFLPNMPTDHPWMDLYRQSSIIFCCGQGAWEDEMRVDSHALDVILNEKGVPHWADFWGYDVNHDWPWWKKQLPYFMGHVLG